MRGNDGQEWVEHVCICLSVETGVMVVITHLASRARAMIPAAKGAEADVPVCESVHFFLRSVVTCTHKVRWKGQLCYWPVIRKDIGCGYI